jgi:S1-C subfamily serine protease
MGVELLPMTPELRAYFGVEPDVGVLVTKVEPDSPAAEAGIQVGDVIRKADEESIRTPRDLVRLVGGFPEDKELKIELSRKGKEREYELVLRGRPRTSYWQGEEIFGPRLHGAFRELRDQVRELERRLGVLEEQSDQE